jgi:hypothetical protein
MNQKPSSPIGSSVTTTVVTTTCILVLAASTWVSTTGPQVVSLSDIVLSSVLVGSMVFPLAHLWVRNRRDSRKISSSFMVGMAILWMMVSVVGIAANLWNGLSDANPWTIARNVEFWAVLCMFGGMFVSSLMQLSTAADCHIQEAAAAYAYRPRHA